MICQHLSQDEIISGSCRVDALNAEQEATNLRGQAEREADLFVNEAKRESKSLKKKHYWRPKKKPENTVEEVDAEFKSERQELKQIESRLTESYQPRP